jgi:outer membrane protein TolC
VEEVETSFSSLAGRQLRLAALDQAVTASRRSLELAEEQYRRGIAAFLAVLEARRSLDQAEAERATARQDAADAAVQAFRALGGGWSVE